MKKIALLIPFFVATLACTASVNTFPVATATPTIPFPPQATFTFTPEPSVDLPFDAIVTGQLSFPSEFIPPMRVVLFSLTNGKAYYVDTAKNQATFSINAPPGTYYVVSYPYEGVAGTSGVVNSYVTSGGPFGGGYTQMVPCGLQYGCEDHSLIPVTVDAGQSVQVDPGDWYAPEGTYPQMPNP